ncbi:MAG: transposase [Ignavibacteriota bacterium]
MFDAVEHVVTFGLEHRTLGQIDSIGVDEIQYAKGHKYLTLVYQIDIGITRLLWVGRERTIESFQAFFTVIGDELASKIVFVCSDMWEPYFPRFRSLPRSRSCTRWLDWSPGCGGTTGRPPSNRARSPARSLPVATCASARRYTDTRRSEHAPRPRSAIVIDVRASAIIPEVDLPVPRGGSLGSTAPPIGGRDVPMRCAPPW